MAVKLSRQEPNTRYRKWVTAAGMETFCVRVGETDLMVSAHGDIREEAIASVRHYRKQIQDYVSRDRQFLETLSPVPDKGDAPEIIRDMIRCSKKAGVGPMATVAGAIAQYVGTYLLNLSEEIIVENGGDIFIKSSCRRTIAVYAGNSPLSGKVYLRVEPEDTPLGVCTSSGTVGHSLSLGKADAVAIYSSSAVLADAVATASCNTVKLSGDLQKGINFARSIAGITGAAIIYEDKLALWGKARLEESAN